MDNTGVGINLSCINDSYQARIFDTHSDQQMVWNCSEKWI